MHIPKGFFQDRIIVLLLSANGFLAILGALLILLRLDGGSEVYIVEYRANLGLSAFKRGGAETLYGFVIFGLIIFLIHTIISMKVYSIRRQMAVAMMALGSLLLVLSIIVSNALLILR